MRVCPICGVDLAQRRKDCVYCSKQCRLIAWAKRREDGLLDAANLDHSDNPDMGRVVTNA